MAVTGSKLPLYLRASIITSCVAFLFGYDTGSIGPVTTMPQYRDTLGHFSPTIHGVIVSSALIPGALTALVAGALAHRFGHVLLVALGSGTYGIGAAIECGSPVLGVFIFGRLIKGIGHGLFLSNVYVQVTEISPARLRGILSALPQFLIVTGVVTGFFTCYGTSRIESSASWRLPPAIGSFIGFVLTSTYLITPPSPRWLLSRGRLDEARSVVAKLGLSEAEQRELLSESQHSQSEDTTPADATIWQTLAQTLHEFAQAFSAPFRARTAFSCFLLAMQQFSGIDGVLFYAPVLFSQAGLSGVQASFLASGVSALVIMAATIPGTLFADKWGRRTSTLLGGSLITTLMLIMGSLYAADQVHPTFGAGRWVVIVSIYLFAIVYSATWAIGMRTFAVESAPRKTRSSTSSLAQSSNWLANYAVALLTPVVIAESSFGVYYLFAGCSLICTVLVWFFMVETKGYSLEAIEKRYSEKATKSSGRDYFSKVRLRSMRMDA